MHDPTTVIEGLGRNKNAKPRFRLGPHGRHRPPGLTFLTSSALSSPLRPASLKPLPLRAIPMRTS